MTQTSLGRKLRILRGERGLSMRSAADLCGVTKETLSALERGTREPHDPTLAKIAKGYGVPFEELIEEPALAGKAEAPEAGPTDGRGNLPLSSPAGPEGGSAGDEARRALYLTRDLEQVRDLANIAQRELETIITTFFDKIPDLSPLEAVKLANGWSWRIQTNVGHVFAEIGRWETRVLGPLSGKDLPEWERELLNQIQSELDKADQGINKLRLEFNRRWSEAHEQARRASSQESLTVEQLLEGVAERIY